jgi:hypothetical protein
VREIDLVDGVAGIVKQAATLQVDRRQVRGEHCEVFSRERVEQAVLHCG